MDADVYLYLNFMKASHKKKILDLSNGPWKILFLNPPKQFSTPNLLYFTISNVWKCKTNNHKLLFKYIISLSIENNFSIFLWILPFPVDLQIKIFLFVKLHCELLEKCEWGNAKLFLPKNDLVVFRFLVWGRRKNLSRVK